MAQGYDGKTINFEGLTSEDFMAKKICTKCKTGKTWYEKDSKDIMCPWIYLHNGKRCAMYQPIRRFFCFFRNKKS